MSTWHKQVSKSLADSVSAVLQDMAADNKSTQNKMLKKGKGEPAGQIKPKQELPEDDEEKPDSATSATVTKDAATKSATNSTEVATKGAKLTTGSKKTKAISKAVRKTSAESKKIKLSKKKEKVEVNPSIKEHRQDLREALEASFDTVFQYSNEAEESFREQWMGEFDSHVSSKDPHAYIDPLQRKVLYIEGLTAQAAANRYLSHCIANVALSGGQYQKYGTRGGDPVASAQQQGTGLTGGVPANYQGKV